MPLASQRTSNRPAQSFESILRFDTDIYQTTSKAVPMQSNNPNDRKVSSPHFKPIFRCDYVAAAGRCNHWAHCCIIIGKPSILFPDLPISYSTEYRCDGHSARVSKPSKRIARVNVYQSDLLPPVNEWLLTLVGRRIGVHGEDTRWWTVERVYYDCVVECSHRRSGKRASFFYDEIEWVEADSVGISPI